jgi:RNA polymerase sigma factor (sigma-70 family)
MIRGGAPLREIRVLFGMGSSGGLADGELLERFATRRDEVGELAFAALVNRHGPMVLRVGRGVLRDPNDVEDAFQATFLVLARKAGSLWVRDSIGPWLHGVAYRVATRARADSARRRRHERRAAEQSQAATATVSVVADDDRDDLGRVLHEEIDRLPGRFRTPVVLCYLEGLTHEEAARQLGCPVGTVRSRLARGRDRLRHRLDRRGVAPALGLFTAATASKRPGVVGPALTEITIQAATRFAAGGAPAALVEPAVMALTRGVLRTMIVNTLLKTAAVLTLAACAATGAASFAMQEKTPGRGEAPAGSAASAPLALAQAQTKTAEAKGRPQSEAERIAERVLKAGSDLFDAKEAARLAATYTEDSEVHLISKDDSNRYKDEVKQGRAEIEQFYRDHFADAGAIDSENFVQYAHLIAPDLIVIHGRFRPNTDQKAVPFVQLRIKKGDEWLMNKLWLFLSSDEQ